MKKIHSLMVILPFVFSYQMAYASSNMEDKTDNYAYGAELTLTNEQSMFSRVSLDQNIYTQTVSSDLKDVRVFNRNGQTVPFTLVNIYDEQKNSQEIPMTIYTISQKNSDSNATTVNGQVNVRINGKNVNINMNQFDTGKANYTVSYLLQVPSYVELDDPITNLQLQFADDQQNWQAKANVFYSTSLTYWNRVTSDVPLMELVANDNNQTLKLSDINFQSNYSSYAKNWMITLQSENVIPALKSVTALAQSSQVKNSTYPIDVSLTTSDNVSAVYTLPSPQPVKELTIELPNIRSVLPVSLYYKTDSTQKEWIKIEDRIIRRTDSYDEPTAINLSNKLIKQIKIQAINSTFDNAPNLVAYRNQVDLVFNSANNSPFILAWGSSQAKAAAIAQSALLSKNDSITNIPKAYIGKSVKLAGEKALQATNNGDPSKFPQWIIWLGLVMGAGLLVVLALKLAKDIKKQ